MSKVIIILSVILIIEPLLTPSLILEKFFAPKFCAVYAARATPKDIIGSVAICSIRKAAVNAAITSGPNVLQTLCIISIPIPSIEYCTDIGMPTFKCSSANEKLLGENAKNQSSLFVCSIGNFIFTYIMHKRADTPCDSTTATAEPGTPQPNFKINNSAKNMFKTEANIKKYKLKKARSLKTWLSKKEREPLCQFKTKPC